MVQAYSNVITLWPSSMGLLKVIMNLLHLSLITGIMGINPSVDLTIEGGIYLNGSHCPGTVRLYCKGMDLTSLRWDFNGSTEITTFLPIDIEAIIELPDPEYTAFIAVELTRVTQRSDPVYGNFASTLTVDLYKLEVQNVNKISCGDPGTFKNVLINIDINRPTVPGDPEISTVMATIHRTAGIIELTVSWMPVPVECPEYQHMINYTVSISERSFNTSTDLNGGGCATHSCHVTINVPSPAVNRVINISLSAGNYVGMSNTVNYNTVIVEYADSGLSTGGAVAATLISTFILSCTLGLILGAAGYHIVITKKNCTLDAVRGKSQTSVAGDEQTVSEQIQYAEPCTKTKQERVKVKKNQAYGRGESVVTHNQDEEHSYEFID